MKQLTTKFGYIYIEDFEYDHHCPGQREEEDRIKIFDSDEKYLGYYTTDTIDSLEEYENLCNTIEGAETLDILLDCVSEYPVMFYSTNHVETIAGMLLYGYFDDETIKELQETFGNWTDDVIHEHDFTNVIGDYHIVVTDI